MKKLKFFYLFFCIMAQQRPSISELVKTGIISIGTEFFKEYPEYGGVKYVGRIVSNNTYSIVEPKWFEKTTFETFNEAIGRIVGYPVNAWKWWKYIDTYGKTQYINEWRITYYRLQGQ